MILLSNKLFDIGANYQNVLHGGEAKSMKPIVPVKQMMLAVISEARIM